MAMSAGEIVVLVLLIIIVGIVIWYFAVAYQFGQTLNNFSYTRGANLDTKDKNKGTVNLTCEQGNEICVWKATAICSGAISSISNTEGGPEPISDGTGGNTPYGQFDINNTIDLTKDMAGKANGKQKYTYNFDVSNRNFGKTTCPMNYDSKSGSGQRPQLISTYSCIPKGSKCVTSNPIPPTPPTPPTPPIPPIPPKSFTRVGSITGMNTISMNNKNQICGTNNKGEIWCSNNYKSGASSVWNKLNGQLNQVSLSDSGSVSGVNIATGNCYYADNFANANWIQIPGTGNLKSQASWTTTRLFNSGEKKVIGNTVTNGWQNLLWVSSTTDPTVNTLPVYNWQTFDSNTNGDLCGIVSTGEIQCFLKNGGGSVNTSKVSFNPNSISVNKTSVYVASESGDILRTEINNIGKPSNSWENMSKGQGFSSLSVANDGTTCATKSDGSVWCS